MLYRGQRATNQSVWNHVNLSFGWFITKHWPRPTEDFCKIHHEPNCSAASDHLNDNAWTPSMRMNMNLIPYCEEHTTEAVSSSMQSHLDCRETTKEELQSVKAALGGLWWVPSLRSSLLGNTESTSLSRAVKRLRFADTLSNSILTTTILVAH